MRLRAQISPNEVQRLAALYSYGILDSDPEATFDDLTSLTAQILGTPIAAISLVEDTRMWFKSVLGLDFAETPIDQSFCAHAILNPDEPLVVEDARTDARFSDNDLVTSEPSIRFYAGMPLVDGAGLALGTLCVFDAEPRTLEPEKVGALKALARLVISHIQFRKAVLSIRRQAELLEEARTIAIEASRGKSLLLSTLSHEIRTPLNGVIGMASLLKTTRLEGQQREYLDTLLMSAEALIRTIDDLADLTDLDSQKLEVEAGPLNIKSLLDEIVVDAPSGLITNPPISAPFNEIIVVGDGIRIRQIVHLVLKHAKLLNATATLTFRFQEGSPNRLVFTVESLNPSGGIETSLSLNIAQRLTEALNGTLIAATGSDAWKATISLPVLTAEANEVISARRGHVLVAEDNQVNVMVIQAMLQERGFDVTCVGSGREAVEEIVRDIFDLVLMDIQMPELDGLEATRIIRQKGGRYGELPIIALTANASAEDREACLAAGMNDYISKPYKPMTITETLQRWGLARN